MKGCAVAVKGWGVQLIAALQRALIRDLGLSLRRNEFFTIDLRQPVENGEIR